MLQRGFLNSKLIVTKRDGHKETIDLDKIHRIIEWASEGLEPLVATEHNMMSDISDIADELIRYFSVVGYAVKKDKKLDLLQFLTVATRLFMRIIWRYLTEPAKSLLFLVTKSYFERPNIRSPPQISLPFT